MPPAERGVLHSVQDVTDAVTYGDSDSEMDSDEADEDVFEVDKENLQSTDCPDDECVKMNTP